MFAGPALLLLVLHLTAPKPDVWDLIGPLFLAGLGKGLVIAPNQDFVCSPRPVLQPSVWPVGGHIRHDNRLTPSPIGRKSIIPKGQQDSKATILNMVANAVESLGRCQLKGIYFDGRWQGFPVPGPGAAAVSPPPAELVTAALPPDGQVELADLPWGWAYPLAGTRRGGGRGCWDEAGEGNRGPF